MLSVKEKTTKYMKVTECKLKYTQQEILKIEECKNLPTLYPYQIAN